MEALEFLKEYSRMCAEYKECYGCPLKGTTCSIVFSKLSEEKMINIIEKTEQWSKEHPIITNEMKFREIFGENAVNSICSLYVSDIKRWLAEPYEERES